MLPKKFEKYFSVLRTRDHLASKIKILPSMNISKKQSSTAARAALKRFQML